MVAAGGCAAKLRSPVEWSAHPQGQSIAGTALFDRTLTPAPSPALPDVTAAVSSRPLAGLRVLDLTRVIAGPIGTRLLAAYGADVLRVDPPGFQEVGALLCDITAGKRRAALNLKQAEDRAQLVRLVREADVIAIVQALPDALFEGIPGGKGLVLLLLPAGIVHASHGGHDFGEARPELLLELSQMLRECALDGERML